MPRDWRNAADYADLRDLDLSGLAWEFLRRSPQYIQAFAALALGRRDAGGHDPTWRFGLRFPLDPGSPAAGAALFWRAEVAPGHVVRLVRAPSGGLGRDAFMRLSAAARRADDGLHLRLREGLQVVIPSDIDRAEALAALVALDAAAAARLGAVGALARLLDARAPAPDPLSAHSRKRVVLMLRALDARAESASYRDIAEGVLGVAPETSTDWRTSSARDVAIRLCRSGRRLMGGGFRRFLTRRR